MKLSQYFVPALKETPKEAEVISHRLMLRAGLIRNQASGIYFWLPLGLRVLQKIQAIIRQEQNAIGAQEMLAATVQPASLWKESGRYDDYGAEMLRFSDRSGRELLYGPTAEEVFTDIARSYILQRGHVGEGFIFYNIQWKFRDERRPRYGVMRGREFLMKDGYSFHLTEEEAKEAYRRIFKSYMKTFRRLNLNVVPVRASTGPIGGDFSHEFHILADTGESTLFYDKALKEETNRCTFEDFDGIYAVSDEKYDPETCPLPEDQITSSKGIEVGHIFYFGTKYSLPMKLIVKTVPTGDESFKKLMPGWKVPVEMGSYGIGVSRLVAGIIEASHDAHGIKWPMSIAPFAVALVDLTADHPDVAEMYAKMRKAGLEVLWHDCTKSIGEMFAVADLLGAPIQVIMGNHTLTHKLVEIKDRHTNDRFYLKYDDVMPFLLDRCKTNIVLNDHPLEATDAL